MHLRSQYGLAQDPAQELHEITTFFRALCDRSQWTYQAKSLQTLPFTQDDLERTLLCTPKTKSVAPNASPGHIVSGLAPLLAPWLHATLTQLWTQMPQLTIPNLWRDAWILCLPKRSVTSPKDLQCAIGKAVLRVIVRKAMQETHHRFVPWPIFAYLRGRSTEHALMRVHQHLRDVRDQCQHLTHNIWSRHARSVPPRCHGGITLSLDLSNAFDSVDRSHLAIGMNIVQLSEPLQHLLLSWLCPVHYHLQHKGHCSSIPVTRGIRQGCVASPYLWLLWTMAFFTDLQKHKSYEWICSHLSVYADDLISQWSLRTVADFEISLHDIGLLLDLFDAFGLQVSLSKSVILMRLIGSSAKTLHKKHCSWVNSQYCLKIPRNNGTVAFLPIVKTHKYLGSILTYVNPEDATLTYRLKSGKLAFFRLIRFLGRNSQGSRNFKIQLWKQCVVSSYIYALFPCGLTRAGCYRFESAMFQDLRRLANNWSHITHVSHLDLALQLKVQPPLDFLQVRWQEHADRHAQAGAAMHPFDLLSQLDITAHWQQLYTQIAAATCERTPHTTNNPSQSWPCPYCSQTFNLRAILRRHIVTKHPELDTKPSFKPARDAKHGMPQCRHCDKKLNTRNNLRLHIENQWCTSFDPDCQEYEPLCAQPQIRHRILDGRWQTLMADRALCRELTSHCCLCGHWCAQTSSLAAHLKREHGDLLTQSAQFRADVDQHVRWESHCHICEQEVRKTHKCPVAMQLAVLKQHLLATPAELRPEPLHVPTPPAKRRSPFDGAYTDTTPVLAFDARRDCRGGYDLCAHCGSSFKDHVGLRRHIEYGRCSKFDAAKPPQNWILRYQPALHELFQIIHPESWLYDRNFLSRLKQECALCGRLFESAKRLASHLAMDHQQAWTDAMPYADHLLTHYQPLGEAGSSVCSGCTTGHPSSFGPTEQ